MGKLYAERDTEALEPHYSNHVDAMTGEGLHRKSAIAAELAWRDKHIASLEGQMRAEGITLNALQLREAAYWANPDSDPEQDETEVRIEWMPKRTSTDGDEMEAGDYLYYIDCPEEGVIGPLGKDPVPDAVKVPNEPAGGGVPAGCYELMESLATALYAAVHAGKLNEADRIKSNDGSVEVAELLDRANAMLATQQPPEGEGSQ